MRFDPRRFLLWVQMVGGETSQGRPGQKQPWEATMKSKMLAMALCMFVGWTGAHRFYLGYKVHGAVQLLTFGGFGIWYWVDLILIALGKLPDVEGNALA